MADESVVKNLAPPELDETSKLLLKAADLIDERGLCKGTHEDAFGAMCFEGALNVASGQRADAISFSAAGSEAWNRMKAALPPEFAPWSWNDAPERTAEEVVSTMRRVALGG